MWQLRTGQNVAQEGWEKRVERGEGGIGKTVDSIIIIIFFVCKYIKDVSIFFTCTGLTTKRQCGRARARA